MNLEGAPKPKPKAKQVTIGPDDWMHGLTGDKAKAKEAMTKICPDDRDTWVSVGMVCKNQGEDWRPLWDEVSGARRAGGGRAGGGHHDGRRRHSAAGSGCRWRLGRG